MIETQIKGAIVYKVHHFRYKVATLNAKGLSSGQTFKALSEALRDIVDLIESELMSR
jgi:hypothetical protein